MSSTQTLSELQHKVHNLHIEPKEVWLDQKQLAKYLSCTVKSIYNYRKSGLIPFHKLSGRIYFLKKEVDASVIGKKSET